MTAEAPRLTEIDIPSAALSPTSVLYQRHDGQRRRWIEAPSPRDRELLTAEGWTEVHTPVFAWGGGGRAACLRQLFCCHYGVLHRLNGREGRSHLPRQPCSRPRIGSWQPLHVAFHCRTVLLSAQILHALESSSSWQLLISGSRCRSSMSHPG